MIFKWAVKTLRAQLRFSIFFILNLTLGLTGFLTLQTFRVSLQKVMLTNSKTFLSADLSLSARRGLADGEVSAARDILGPQREESRLYEFFSMVNTKAGARLVQVKAIEDNYPFFGQMTLASGRKITGSSQKEISTEDKVWVYPELLNQLSLQVGDKLQLGDAEYTIADSVADDSTQTFRLSTLAPKVYVGLKQIEKSHLVQKGTTFTEALLFRLKDDSQVEAQAKEMFKKIPDPAVQVTTAKEAGEDSAKPLAYLSDYLGLVSLVALFLAMVGSAFLYRSFFSRQIRSMAIYNVLGLQFGQISQILVVQVLVLGVISASLALLGVMALFPALSLVLRSLSPLEIPLALTGEIIGLSFLLATLGSLTVGGFFVLSLRDLNPSQLFQEQFQASFRASKTSMAFLVVPLVFFAGLSVWQAHSWKIGGLFFGLFFASVGIVFLLNLVFLKLLGRGLAGFSWIFKHVGLQLARKLRQNLSTAVALSLGSLLMTLLPQLKGSLQSEVQTPRGSALPSLFLFDIQDEQLSGLKDILKGYQFPELVYSPLVRARILKVNDSPFEKVTEASRIQTREEETENRFRNRGFNLSYRDKLHDSEAIVEGQFWQAPYDPTSSKMAEVSVEAHFADRLKFHIGDQLTFDVQGVEIQGKITSLRSVKWNTFQPNFFVQFQPGVLDDAPKTWVVSVPTLARDKANELQNQVAKAFPNISAVDVSRTVEKALGMADKMSWALQFMAALCFATGFFVLYSVILQQVQESRWDLNLQKMMGASFLQSGSQIWLQYSLLGLVASLVGSLLSLGVAAILSVQVFEMTVSFDGLSIFWTVLGATGISFLLSLVASWRVIQAKPLLVLQG